MPALRPEFGVKRFKIPDSGFKIRKTKTRIRGKRIQDLVKQFRVMSSEFVVGAGPCACPEAGVRRI